MRCHDDVGVFQEGVTSREWLRLCDVEACSGEVTGSERLEEGVLVDE